MSKHKSRITNTKRQIIIHIPKLKEKRQIQTINFRQYNYSDSWKNERGTG